jgi:transcriptional regulator with XRE-family HTH domain
MTKKPQTPGEVGWFLREWRDYRGLSQQQLADLAGLSKPYVSEVERGLKGYTQPTLFALAKALDCEPIDLLLTDPEAPLQFWQAWRDVPPENREQAVAVLKTFKIKHK